MPAVSKRPYLLRALFEWIVESELTPYILAAAEDETVVVPRQYVNDGKIVLNVSPAAVRDLLFGDDHVSFNGRFAGTPFAVQVPVAFVLAIYAKETGEGMMFDAEPDETTSADGAVAPDPVKSDPDAGADSAQNSPGKKPRPGPHLKVINSHRQIGRGIQGRCIGRDYSRYSKTLTIFCTPYTERATATALSACSLGNSPMR